MAVATGADEIIMKGFRDMAPPDTILFATSTSALKCKGNQVMSEVRYCALVDMHNVLFFSSLSAISHRQGNVLFCKLMSTT
jgi:hypothetical protein